MIGGGGGGAFYLTGPRACKHVRPVVSNWPALFFSFFFQPALGMCMEVLCPMLTCQLFTTGPAPCVGPVSPFPYKQLQQNKRK